ncbi:MAG: hypothetical protein NC237_03515 [Eubacterium sp.]|nr:hypothetical protein [Eubacterium sp.]MCM1417455.1 hypothetical protein [Roseburia sp.]
MKTNKRRRLSALLLGVIFLSGACSARDAETPETTATTAAPDEEAEKETDPAEAKPEPEDTEGSAPSAETERETPRERAYIDESGHLTEAAKERIAAILADHPSIGFGVYPGLFDFTLDGVPELYLVYHSGGQGLMPTVVYTLDGEELGSFDGYSREGFCRFSYGEDCVYIHNKYEHSAHSSCDLVTRAAIEDGVLMTEDLFWRPAAVGDNFPLKEPAYFLDGEETDRDSYNDAYNTRLFEGERMTREANELSLCVCDLTELPDDGERADAIVSLYHQYIAAKNAAEEKFGEVPSLFAFDDFDQDGKYEAFVQASPSDAIQFWDGAGFSEIPGSETGGAYDFTRIGDLLFVQPFRNGLPCSIYGVHDGEFYEHENSCRGMLIRPSEYYPFECNFNDEFVLYDSTFEPSHTHKPYFFVYPCTELTAVPVTEEDFADRADVLTALDELKAELSLYPEGAEIVGMYLRGGEYLLHVNFTLPAETEDGEGAVYPLPYYRTYLIQNRVVQIDEGAGHYTERLGD